MSKVKFLTFPTKRLAISLPSSSMTVTLEDLKGWDGVALSAYPAGTILYGVLRDSAKTMMEIIEIDGTSFAGTQFTALVRGLAFDGSTSSDPTRILDWNSNDTLVDIGTNPPQLLGDFLSKSNDQTENGVVTFTQSPIVPTPTSSQTTAAASVEFVNNAAYAGSPNASQTVKGIVEIATAAEINAGTAIGATGAIIATSPDQLALSIYGVQLPSSDQKAALAGTSGTPSSTNKFVTDADTTTTASAGKVIRGKAVTGKLDESVCQTTNANIASLVTSPWTQADGLHSHGNIKFLPTASDSSNSGAWADKLSYTITAGALSTKHGVRIKGGFRLTTSNGGSSTGGTAGVQVLFAGVVVATLSNQTTTTSYVSGTFDVFIANSASASAQIVSGSIRYSSSTSTSNPFVSAETCYVNQTTQASNTAVSVDVKIQTYSTKNGNASATATAELFNCEIIPVTCTP